MICDLKKLELVDDRKTQINGDLNFKNLFAKKRTEIFYVCEVCKLTSSYDDLIVILPTF
jgi:hypothetical protein